MSPAPTAVPAGAPVLPDLLGPGLRVLFCGTAAGPESARRRAYYAGPGNRFWPTLHAAGLTPRRLAPEEYPALAAWGIGLTDACKTAHGLDHAIPAAAYDPARLEAVVALHRPGLVAFTSKRAAGVALGVRDTSRLAYGPQERPFAGRPAWVLPSPSGAARRHWSPEPWHALARAVG